MKCNRCNSRCYFSNEGVWICPNMMCDAKQRTDISVTEFNKLMTKDERDYYGEKYDETR